MENSEPVNVPGAPDPGGAPAAPERAPAGFWIRWGAFFIDGLAVWFAQFLAAVILFFIGAPGILILLLTAALWFGYFTLMTVKFGGQTLGKMAAGCAVVRTDGSALTYGRALGRALSYVLSSLPVNLGFIAAAFTPQKRALHDYIADTRVLYVGVPSKGRQGVVIAAGFIPVLLFLVGFIGALLFPMLAGVGAGGGGALDEASTKGNLGGIRASLAIYYGDKMGEYPPDISTIIPEYLNDIPYAVTGEHGETEGVEIYGAEACAEEDIESSALRDTGKWGYIGDAESPCHGAVFVDCTHTDSKGRIWHTY